LGSGEFFGDRIHLAYGSGSSVEDDGAVGGCSVESQWVRHRCFFLSTHSSFEHGDCDGEHDDAEADEDDEFEEDGVDAGAEDHDFSHGGGRIGEREEVGEVLHVPGHLGEGEEDAGEEHHGEHEGHHDHGGGFFSVGEGGDEDAESDEAEDG